MSGIHVNNWGQSNLTVIHVRNNGDSGRGELCAQTASHGHAEGDIKAFLVLVQWVINYHDPAGLLCLSLVKAQDAVMVLGPGDVIWVRQHCSRDGACGWNWRRRNNRSQWSKLWGITACFSQHITLMLWILSSLGKIWLGFSQSAISCVLLSKLKGVLTQLIHVISFFYTCDTENVDRERVVLHTEKVMCRGRINTCEK